MSDTANILRYEEGLRLSPYLCSEGYPSIGYGFKLGPKGAALENYQFTISVETAETWLHSNLRYIAQKMGERPELLQCLTVANAPRQAILYSMIYQMGMAGVLGFRKALAAWRAGRWDEAAAEMLNSQWARQTPARAQRHAAVVRTGSLAGIYPPQ